MLNRIDQSGDTIVEVLIAISIVGLVLVGAYQSTNRNIASTQDAQERNQAAKLVQSQIEYLRGSGGIALPSTCFDTNGSAQDGSTIPTGTNNPCIVTSTGQPVIANSGYQPAYTLNIIKESASYKVTASWDSLVGGQAPSNVTIYYQL